MRILSVNLGSSSLKLDLWTAGSPAPLTRVAARGIGEQRGSVDVDGETADRPALGDHAAALQALLPHLRDLDRVERIGHRVVHGGPHRRTAWVDDGLLQNLRELTPLSPVHLPPAIAVMEACRERFPRIPQAAVFDTAFHAGLPARAREYAVPAAWREGGIRRYGFHGIACADAVSALGDDLAPRTVLLHLGAGCSATALQSGRSVDTTMGFTPLEGLTMATRSGDVDPGVLVYMLRERGLDVEALDHALNRDSGLRGLSGYSDDMKTLLADQQRPEAALAVEVFCYRAAKAVAALAVGLQGLDQLVFTGGIGEHGAEVRERIVGHLHWMGLELDDDANAAHGPVISTRASRVSLRVVAVDEGREIARETAALE